MKKHTYKFVALLLTTIFFFSCSVDDFQQQGKLTEETLFLDLETTKLALTGIYIASRPTNLRSENLLKALSISGQELKPGAYSSRGEKKFHTNSVKVAPLGRQDGILEPYYLNSYKLINLANLFVSRLSKGVSNVSETEKNEMLAEAKALRANTYFSLLKVFGQFYDLKSEYGIIATTKVIDGFTLLKRNTVQETYNLIVSDLQFAIKHASNEKTHDFINKTFAQGLLAKVYLYMGNFPEAVLYSKNVINTLGGSFDLEKSYSDIFTKGINSKEVLYAPYFKAGSKEENQIRLNADFIVTSEYLKNLAIKDSIKKPKKFGKRDPRYKFTFGSNESNYNKYPTSGSSHYHLRLAEVYLIYAEALARTNGDSQTALEALNKIRKRAGVPLKEYNNKATFLEDVRNEKMLELCMETGESWFDLIRYDILGDLVAKDLKPTITNRNKFIFPIGMSILANNHKFGPQNPGY